MIIINIFFNFFFILNIFLRNFQQKKQKTTHNNIKPFIFNFLKNPQSFNPKKPLFQKQKLHIIFKNKNKIRKKDKPLQKQNPKIQKQHIDPKKPNPKKELKQTMPNQKHQINKTKNIPRFKNTQNPTNTINPNPNIFINKFPHPNIALNFILIIMLINNLPFFFVNFGAYNKRQK